MVERVQPERMGVCRNAIDSRLVGCECQSDHLLGSAIHTVEDEILLEEFPCCFQIGWLGPHLDEEIGYERDAEHLGDIQEHGLGGSTAGDFRDPAP